MITPRFLRRLPLAGLLTAFLLVSASAFAETVRVTTDRTNIWAAPNGTAGIIAVVDRDTVLEVRGRQGRWLQVDDPTDPRRRGYVLASQTATNDGRPLPGPASSSAATGAARPPAATTPPRRATTAPPPPSERPAPKTRASSRHGFPKLFVYAGGVLSPKADTFDGVDSRSLNVEQETRTTTYSTSTKPGFEVGIGSGTGRIATTFIASRRQSTEPAELNAQLPHPFYFNQPRTLTGTFDAPRTETAVHVQVNAALVSTARLQILVGGGPSVFIVRQALLDALSYDSVYPYDTATLTGATTVTRTKKAAGWNVQLDAIAALTRRVGVQVSGRWSAAKIDFSDETLDATSHEGHAQISAGLRLSF